MSAPDDLRTTAARWFSQARDPDFSPEQQQALSIWLAERPEHRAEYAALQRIWTAAGAIDPARLRHLAAGPETTEADWHPASAVRPPSQSSARRSPALRAAFYTATAALALGLAWLGWHQHDASTQLASNAGPVNTIGGSEYRTEPGERKTIRLPDGSSVQLNTRTRMVVRIAATGERSVDLLDGEAMFEVAHDASRPFVIQAGTGKVTVTGTRFDVRRSASRTDVAVESGSVIVQGLGDAQSSHLSAGLGTTVDGRGAVASPSPVDLAAALAWRTGKLVFNDAPLANVVAEVSRYRRQPVRVADGAAGALRVSSVFSADDTDGLLAALPQMLPVGVRQLPDGSAEVFLR